MIVAAYDQLRMLTVKYFTYILNFYEGKILVWLLLVVDNLIGDRLDILA
ncbi:hypothetical protein NIES4073_84850 [Kalymmatonema gypsitolerans NIES-4073]|nr:hypothetical protein NIES4073_84850 [Scytonema sp. NIES-4073]